MNRNSTIALLGIAIVASVGMMGVNGFLAMPSTETASTNTVANGGENMLGHITVVAKDSQGNVKSYRQMDNVVSFVGRTCTAAALFGQPTTAGTNNCNPGTFKYIGIGSVSTVELSSDTGLNAPTFVTTRTGADSITNSTNGAGAVTTQSASFTMGSGSTTQVGEADLADASSTSNGAVHMFAHKSIVPVINTVSGDTLTVTWTVTTG
ncbi:MAG: hypothetical protein HY222_07875 [Thaumarchaeota archaeon]|nr:hypothetical protein [Nitrososphaerota archaeon]MBI3642293.1 hypothetical protein [Nitrososphaerota archaeon]